MLKKWPKQLLKRRKSNNTFLDTYAWVLYKRGKAREAAKIMEKIINSGRKNDAEYFEHYGLYSQEDVANAMNAVKNWETAMIA